MESDKDDIMARTDSSTTPRKAAWTFVSTFVAAVALGAATFGHWATAEADPNNGGGTGGEWDIGVYDSCLKNHPPLYNADDKLDWAIHCCYTSGGVWGSGGSCVAPSAATTSSTPPFGPPARVAPPNMSAPPPPAPPNVSNLPIG